MSAIRRASASARAYLLSDRPLEFVYYSNPRYFVILRTYSLVFIVLYTLPAFDFCLARAARPEAPGPALDAPWRPRTRVKTQRGTHVIV